MDLPHTSLEIVQREVGDAVLDAVQVHLGGFGGLGLRIAKKTDGANQGWKWIDGCGGTCCVLKVSRLFEEKVPDEVASVFDKSALQNAKKFRHNLKGCPGA